MEATNAPEAGKFVRTQYWEKWRAKAINQFQFRSAGYAMTKGPESSLIYDSLRWRHVTRMILFSGCLLGAVGCREIDSAGFDADRYTVSEDGAIKSYGILRVSFHSVVPMGLGNEKSLLVDPALGIPQRAAIWRIIDCTPDYRNLEPSLRDAVDEMHYSEIIKELNWDGESPWFISNRPLVIGISTMRDTLGMRAHRSHDAEDDERVIKLVTSTNLATKVDTLVVFDGTLPIRPDEVAKILASPALYTIRLPEATAIQDVMRLAPWIVSPKKSAGE